MRRFILKISGGSSTNKTLQSCANFKRSGDASASPHLYVAPPLNVLDENFRHSVKLGNNTKMNVMGKGSVKLLLNGMNLVVTEVYYIPELKKNLLSIGQLQEKGLAILIKGGICKIFHLEEGLIIQTNMTANRMFILLPQSQISSKAQSDQCFPTKAQNLSHIWHRRL
uniref:Copia-type polyprotein, putative; 28768-32772, putative n=1 Tax=Medicago truncatula TaxID=3880 RepID=Q2HSQ2_MEDTR|nr:copia-type polyprotein, putative; 28768-32772, putative [Medicago truncatula]